MRIRQLANCIRYVVSEHHRLPGVRLSKLGHWGNIPYDDEASAEAAALADARGSQFTIERESR